MVLLGCFTPDNVATGPNQSLLGTVRALGDRYDFSVIAEAVDGEEPGRWTRLAGLDRLPLAPGATGAVGLVAAVRAAAPDLIVTNGFFDRQLTIPFLLARWLGRVPDTRVLLSPRGEFSPGALALKPIQKRIWLSFARRSGLIDGTWLHATGSEERGHIAAQLPGYASAILLGPNIRMPSNPPPRMHRGDDEPLRLVYLSRIDRKKGLHLALNAIAKSGVASSLDIYGPISDEPYWRQCATMIENSPPTTTTRYHGTISQKDVPAALAKSDLFILPTAGENFGHAIVDALSAGVPVLIGDETPWTGLESADAGWSVDPQDEEALSRAIRVAAGWKGEETLRRCACARDYIASRIDPDRDIQALAACYAIAIGDASHDTDNKAANL